MMKKQVSRGRKFLFFLLLDYIIYRFSRQKSNKINLSPKILAFSFLFISFLFISSFNFFLLAAEDKVSVLASSPLNLGAFAQIRYTAYSSEGIDSFSLRRVRLTMNATVLNNLNFRVQLEQTKSPNLVDAYLSYHPKSWVELRAGQFKIPFSYENLKSAAELDLINRSLVVESLCPGRDIGSQGRDIGAMVFLKASFFEAFFGLFNGSGINRLDNDKSKDKAYRLIISPWRSLRAVSYTHLT
ncbi:MAG: OprO/OprP family phosphate-selective porin, partial [Candidatus Aminicenantes bacterium]|nr:OprO/OprP family phosphate-selective porin [Candidatus Aminicenantes bacterium]